MYCQRIVFLGFCAISYRDNYLCFPSPRPILWLGSICKMTRIIQVSLFSSSLPSHFGELQNSLQCLARTKFRISNQNTLKINKIKIIWGGNTYGLVIDLKCKCNFFLTYCTLVKMNSANDCVISIICSPRMCSLLEVLIQKHCARLKRSGNVFHNTLEDLTNCWPAYHHHENQN